MADEVAPEHDRPDEPAPPPADAPASGDLPASASGDVGASGHMPASRGDARAPGRLVPARLAPLLLLAAMAVTGVLAAISVTPPPDEDALARPEGSDLVIAGAAPASWDPARISDAASAQLLSQVFEGLTVLDARADVRPALAEEWEVRDGGRRVDFRLRPGLTFSDGSPISAADARRSWLRLLDPAAPSPLASLLGDVRGARAYVRGELDAGAVGIEAEDGLLSVTFSRPAAWFPAVAAAPSLAVVPEAIDAQTAASTAPSGIAASGAYRPIEQDGSLIRLEAHPGYWAGPPAVERIGVLTDLGGRSRVDVFEDGAVDWTTVSEADAAWIRYDSRLGPQLRRSEEMSVDLLGFDTDEPPFDDARVRRAFARSVDWRRLTRLSGAEGARAGSLPSFLPPGMPGRGDAEHLPAHDPEAARRELAEAGYPGGRGFPPVALTTYGVGPAEAIAAELHEALGVPVSVERRPFGEHSRILDSDTPPMWTLAWNADYPHAHSVLGLLLAGDSSANVSGWSDPRFDAILAEAAATDDPAEQERLYDAAQAILTEEVPMLPLGHAGTWSLSREGLLGAEVSGVGILRFAGLAWER